MTAAPGRRRRGPAPGIAPGRVRRLVAIRDDEPCDGLDEHPVEAFDLPNLWGLPPEDGDLVGIPVPCARALSGYWCTCTGSFRSVRGEVPMSRARIELVDASAAGEVAVPFIPGPPSEQLVPFPTEADAARLAALLHAWPVGTVVERRGLAFAPVHRPSTPYSAARSDRFDQPYDDFVPTIADESLRRRVLAQEREELPPF